jgi:predicted ABC-class ATPase
MHLCGPALSLIGKKKGKVKFRNAEEARKARELDASWKELQKKYELDAEAKKRQRALAAAPLSYKLSTPPGRTTSHNIPSRNTGDGIASSKPVQQYTGTKMKGIGVMHKSNSVPIFSDEEAVAIATMRRN